MNNITCDCSPAAASSNTTTVSWTNAFWNLVPIALIAMGSPSGRVCDAPSAIGPWMRVSPIICLIDMLSIYIRLPWYAIHHGFVEAIRRLMVQRFGFEDELSEFSQNGRHTYSFRLVMLLLSTVSIVKLYAFAGLILTRLWASMFLASFPSVELLVFVSKTCLDQPWPRAQVDSTGQDATPDSMPEGSGPWSLPYPSVAVSVFFALYFGMEGTQAIFELHGHVVGHIPCVGIVLLVYGSAPAIATSVYSYIVRPRAERTRFARASGILLLAILVVPGRYLVSWLQRTPGKSIISRSAGGVMIGAWVVIFLWWAGNTLAPVVEAGRRQAQIAEYLLSRYFFCLNLVIAVTFFCFSYDPTKTVKPAWTEILG